MTQSGNGHSKEVKTDELTVYTPAFAPGDEEAKIGYYESDPKQEEGRVVQDLPQEITGNPSTPDRDDQDTES